MKVKRADHTSRQQSTKKEIICKDHHKKPLQNQKNPNQTKKPKPIHIDAYICINVKKKNPYSLRHQSNVEQTAGHCILKVGWASVLN